MKFPYVLTALAITTSITLAQAKPAKQAKPKRAKAVPAAQVQPEAAPADSAKQEPVAAPADSAKQEPAVAPADTAKKEPVVVPADSAKKEPAVAPADTAKKEPAEAPADTAKKEPAVAPADTAKKEPAVAPADSAKQEPVVAPADTAKQEPVVAPADTAKKEPAVAPADTAKKEPAVAPADSAKQEPVVAPADTTMKEPAPAPADTAKQEPTPVADSVVAPVDSVAKDTVLAPADTTVKDSSEKAPISVFVADAEPPAKLLTGTKLEENLHGFLRADQSPYLVEKELFVESHSVLVIEPGVVILFAPQGSLNIQGQLIVSGTRGKNVEFKSASSLPKKGDWKGIVITGNEKSEIRNAVIANAENGIVLENSKLFLSATTIEKSSSRGLYTRNSEAEISDCSFFDNDGIALQSSNYSITEIERTRFISNKTALLNDELSQTNVASSAFEENGVGVVDKGNSYLSFNNTKVNQNQVGAISDEVLEKSVKNSVDSNTVNFDSGVEALLATVPADPEVPGIKRRPVSSSENINDLLQARGKQEDLMDTTQKSWSIIGNVMLGGNYHYVQTRRNHSQTPDIVGEDTIAYKKHYKNYMQVPGFGAEASAYLLMTAPDGSTLEFNTDLTADSWNHFAPNPVTLTYKTDKHYLVVGDNQKSAGDIYMASLPLFGVDYTLSLLTNNAKEPLFQLNAFGGENQRPLLVGDRHPSLYNNYIEEGEAQAQRMAYGASLKWAPVRRFDATFGVLYADDEIENPLLRDGSARSKISSEPIQTSLTAFADGNWLFYPGDIALKGMVAVGRADTAMVHAERAINQVFSDADISVSSYSKLRELMQHEALINTLSNKELQEIFGENSTLTYHEMRETLKNLIDRAKVLQREKEESVEDSRFAGLNWGSQNFAIGASLDWSIYKTRISGHIKYVGEDFYSVGSADQRADTREFGGELEQFITKFWTLNFAYDLNVENAANGSKTNLFGLGEGTRWGFFGEASDKWLDEHELDKDRTKYIQKFNLTNSFKIGQNIDLKVGYNLDYRTQYRNTQLHGDYVLEDAIYKDKWFKPRSGKTVAVVEYDGEKFEVDEERWTAYNNLAKEEYLASRLHERALKHNWNLEGTFRALKSVIKVGGSWTLRTDYSEFEKDSLVKDMHLADTTWEKLGYYYGGADFFEQVYPVSVNTTLNALHNNFAITPRFKSYTRDNMSESEIIIEDELEIPFLNKFLVLNTGAQFRYLTTTWEEGAEDVEENETDVIGNVSLRVNHTKKLYTEWYVGAGLYYRPDNRSDEYKDIFGGVRVYYGF